MQRMMKAVAAVLLMVAVTLTVGCKPDNNDSDVRVTTFTPQDITNETAVCGGEVSVPQGLTPSELGVCWGTSLNPIAEDAHRSTTDWNDPFVCTITGLEQNTNYHVRVYALCDMEYYYGEDKSFTTDFAPHEYVDLGLPSGTLWATYNVGAETPDAYGYYFAWGETEPKTTYDWTNYKYCNGDANQLTKYCNNSTYGYIGFTDTLVFLLPEDDAAIAYWGKNWCIPSDDQWRELFTNTSRSWRSQNGVYGSLFTASNGNTLFLPAAGYYAGDEFFEEGSGGAYWSNSIQTTYPYGGDIIHSGYSFCMINAAYRKNGLPVRAVRSLSRN